MHDAPLRLALIGAGRWGSVIAKTLRALPQCEIAYQVTREWQTLTEKKDIDGVIIATPPSTHAAIASAFIERGIPVFIEKPMTLRVEDARALVNAAEKTNTPIFVGHIHLYNPAYREAKKISQDIGKIRLLIGEGTNNGPYRNDYSAMWDWAPHDISMMLDITGEMPSSVAAWGVSTLRPGTTAYDASQIKLNFPSGAVGIIFSSWLIPEKRKHFTIVGEKSSIVYDDTLPEKKITFFEHMGPTVSGTEITRQEPTVSYPSYDAGMPLTLELEAFLETIRTKQKPETDARSGLEVITILDAAEQSIAAGGTLITIQK